jgi:hypothetical protein
LARRAAEVVFRATSRRLLARLDQADPGRCQTRILLGLIHQAQRTRFGLDHDFRRIRTVADYRRLVPLAPRIDLWADYWETAFPDLDGPSQAKLQPAIPSSLSPSPGLHAVHRAGLRTALALMNHARPKARLLAGRIVSLHEEGPAERLPALLRPYTKAAAAVDMDGLATVWAGEAVTCIVGPAEQLLLLAERLRTMTGKSVNEVWPGLTAVLCSGPPAPVQRLRAEAGPSVLVLDAVWQPEGMLAVEDPRLCSLRLLHDHGLYYEFLPVHAAGDPPRLGLDEVEVGVPHELVVTSPAGLWSCRTGRTLCLERRDPPLVRFLETPAPAAVAPDTLHPRVDAVTTPVRPPHRQSAGTPAALPGNFAHTPWSALAGRR